ncbi:MAG: hypothetical protein KAS53_00610 [Candidatus Cloacimonetes bacterium]|nr:hypothetical protein [Candidatus Cloacimonadota bacterium]
MNVDNSKEKSLKTTFLIYPYWGALFLLIGGAFLVVIGISVRLILGLSAVSDRVFAIEALLSGFLAELVFRRLLNRKLVIAPKLKIPFIYFWPLLCFYVFIARPFE